MYIQYIYIFDNIHNIIMNSNFLTQGFAVHGSLLVVLVKHDEFIFPPYISIKSYSYYKNKILYLKIEIDCDLNNNQQNTFNNKLFKNTWLRITKNPHVRVMCLNIFILFILLTSK